MTRSELHVIVETAPDLMPSTRNKFMRDLNAWIIFAGVDPKNWTPANAQAFYNSLIARGLKAQSANRLLASVAYASRWWAQQLNKPELDFVRIRHARVSGKLPKHGLSPEQCEALVKACIGPTAYDKRDLAMIVVGLETGMRSMSLASMECGTTDERSTMVAMKGAVDRVAVPLSDAAGVALGAWLPRLNRISRVLGWRAAVFQPIQSRIAVGDADGACALTAGDKPLSPSAIAKIVDSRAQRAGIGHVNPHMFRHTFITDRVQRGYQPHEIASMTAHKLPLGALGGYMDMQAIGEKIRNSTPAWLTTLINTLR